MIKKIRNPFYQTTGLENLPSIAENETSDWSRPDSLLRESNGRVFANTTQQLSFASAFNEEAGGLSVEEIYYENEALAKKCKELKDSIAFIQREGDLLKYKTASAIGSMNLAISSLTEDKIHLKKQRGKLEQKTRAMRMKNSAYQ